MRVKSAPTVAQESNREAVLLDLASKWEFKNKRHQFMISIVMSQLVMQL